MLTNPKIHKRGFTIKTIQKGGGGPPSTIVPALKVLNRATAKKQNIKANSPNKIFLGLMRTNSGEILLTVDLK